MKISLISCIILSLLFCGCVKNDDMCGEPEPRGVLSELDSLGLPPATTTGENTFGCLINGEPWRPIRQNSFGSLSYNIDFSYGAVSPGYFAVNMLKEYEGESSNLAFLVVNAFDINEYHFPDVWAGGTDFQDFETGAVYSMDSTYTETNIEITRLDVEEDVISGTFHLRFIQTNLDEEEEPDTLRITEGRFDLMGN